MRSTAGRRIAGAVLVGATMIAVQAADASPWIKVAQGLALFDTQVGLQKNYLGDGWDMSLVSPWNNTRFDFGLADLTLTGLVTSDFNYTRRIIPALDFRTQTVQTPLAYTFTINDGIQDLVATGEVGIFNRGSINTLGFYDLEINISNRGQYSTEGYLLTDSGTLDFDIGPINVTGNIFIDMIATVTEPFFLATGQPNVFAKISGRAAKQVIQSTVEEAIRAKVASGKLLTESEIQSLIGMALTASLFDDSGMASIESLLGEMSGANPAGEHAGNMVIAAVPEPATVMLLGAGFLTLARRRRRGR